MSTRLDWEERSKRCGDELRSVLFKGLPAVFNEHFHLWHQRVLHDAFPPLAGPRVLDVGCGYGRLVRAVLARCPGAEITGVDVSETFAKLFVQNGGRRALVGSVEDLPADLGSFDYVLCVTVLMYLEPGRVAVALRNLLSRLAPGGRLLLIENDQSGSAFQTAFGLLSRRRRSSAATGDVDTGGHCFRRGEIQALLEGLGAKPERRYRMPATTLAFLPLYVVCRHLPRSAAEGVLATVRLFDSLLARAPLPSVYVAYVVPSP